MENTRILNRIVEINITNVKYADIELCGNTCFVGTNNYGKTSLQRAILFFYSANSRGLGIAQSQKTFEEHHNYKTGIPYFLSIAHKYCLIFPRT